MKLLSPHDVPPLGVVRTFRHSRLTPLLLFAVVTGGTAWWVVSMVRNEDAEWIHWLPTLLGVLMAFVVLVYVWKSLKPTNWLVKATEDGLYVKFRSYLNDRLPQTGPTVVHIPYAEIERIGWGRRKLTLPDRDGKVTATQLRYVDIELRHKATDELKEALRAERGLRPAGSGAKHHDYPLRVTAPNRLRLEWKVSPGPRAALETLQRYAAVDSEEQVDTQEWNRMDRAAREAMVVELAELGERMRARHLAQELYGLERTEAKAYIDEIMGREQR